jgi:hypothetical protein
MNAKKMFRLFMFMLQMFSIIHVLQDLKQPVISQATQKNLGMLPPGYPNQCVEIFDINAHQIAFSNLLANIHKHPTKGIKQNDLKILTNDFPLIFDGVCRPMAGPACNFEFKKDAVPVVFRGSRPVTEPLIPLLKKELDLLEQQDCIQGLKTNGLSPPHRGRSEERLKYPSVRRLYYFKQKCHPPTFRNCYAISSGEDDPTWHALLFRHRCLKRIPPGAPG